jgi:micrococcal nuclease
LGSFRVSAIGAAAACAVAGLAAGCAPTENEPADRPATTTATVEWVSDGDTLRLTNGRKVRLLQIDAPEREADCYGRAATRALIELVPKGTTVTLEADPSLDDRDSYGRLLRYVRVAGDNVNLALIERGAAAPYFFRKERGRYAEAFLSAAKAARASGRGFWKACPDAELNPGLGSVTGRASRQRG